MSDPGSRRGRVHDAEGAREAILNAAEEVFAEHGFDGARIDAIAAKAGYNKSLLFQYFGDKIGLYAMVASRARKGIRELEARVLAPLLEDESVATDAHRFRKPLFPALRSSVRAATRGDLMQAMSAPYPATFTFDPPEKVANWRPLVQWLLAIPHFVVLYALGFLSQIVGLVSWIVILFTGELPEGLANVPAGQEEAVIESAEECPGECIFIEID